MLKSLKIGAITKQSIINDHEYIYFFDITKRSELEIYFKMKNKHDYSFNQTERESFIIDAVRQIKDSVALDDFDTIVTPQTSNDCLIEIVGLLGKKVHYLQKNSKEKILENLDREKMMRAERRKLYASIEGVETIKMANIAGNQRSRVSEYLFEKDESIENALYIDDSIFSGFTFLAAHRAVNIKKSIVFFSKQ